MEYNVLWIDDQPEDQDAFFEWAEMKNIELTNFKTSKAGIDELTNNLSLYDAVILDAKVYNESEDEVAKLTGMQNSIKAIERLSSIRVIPYFIFSGQTDVVDNGMVQELLGNTKIYKKGSDNDTLFIDIKKAADQQPETQIRHEHYKAFKALEDYDQEASNTLLKILKSVKNGGKDFDDKEQFTQIRIILEMMFRKANEIGILHDKCIKRGQVNLTDSSLFLAGSDTRHSDVRCIKIHFPRIIADAVKEILFITGGASHTTEADHTQEINMQEYRKSLQTPYLLYSLTFRLMDILIWFDKYRKENSSLDENKSFWENIEHLDRYNKYEVGEISSINSGGWGIVKIRNLDNGISIHRENIRSMGLSEGDEIKFTIRKSLADNIEIR